MSSTESGATLESVIVDMNTFWLLIGAILVFCECRVCGCTCLDVAEPPIHDNPQRFFQLQSSAPFIILFWRQSLDVGCFDWGMSQSPDVLLRSSKLTFRGNKCFSDVLLPICCKSYVICTLSLVRTLFTTNVRAHLDIANFQSGNSARHHDDGPLEADASLWDMCCFVAVKATENKSVPLDDRVISKWPVERSFHLHSFSGRNNSVFIWVLSLLPPRLLPLCVFVSFARWIWMVVLCMVTKPKLCRQGSLCLRWDAVIFESGCAIPFWYPVLANIWLLSLELQTSLYYAVRRTSTEFDLLYGTKNIYTILSSKVRYFQGPSQRTHTSTCVSPSVALAVRDDELGGSFSPSTTEVGEFAPLVTEEPDLPSTPYSSRPVGAHI